eukprot:2269395-Prymnesium_polylepis.1
MPLPIDLRGPRTALLHLVMQPERCPHATQEARVRSTSASQRYVAPAAWRAYQAEANAPQSRLVMRRWLRMGRKSGQRRPSAQA